jgi:hypothetical protein
MITPRSIIFSHNENKDERIIIDENNFDTL